MPVLDLTSGSTLDPWAPFRLLALMCNPQNKLRRSQLLSKLKAEADSAEKSNVKPLTTTSFFGEYGIRAQHGATAGNVLLTLIQLEAAGIRPTIKAASKILWISSDARNSPPTAPEYHGWIDSPKLIAKPEKLRNTFWDYQSVCHLWATFVLSMTAESNSVTNFTDNSTRRLLLDTPEGISDFVAVAIAVARLGSGILLGGPKRRTALDLPSGWKIRLPAKLVKKYAIDPLLLSSAALAALGADTLGRT